MTKRRNDTPLTAEQQKLAEDNISMAYWFVKKHPKYASILGYDDACSVASMAVVYACRTWKKDDKAQLTTYIHCVILRHLYRAIATEGLIRRPEPRAGQKAYPAIPMAEFAEEMIIRDQDSDAIRPDELTRWIDERSLDVLRGIYAEGKTQREVARELGVSSERVRQIAVAAVARLREKMWAHCEGGAR